MRKFNIILISLFCIFLLGFASAEVKDVYYKVSVSFTPDCNTVCFNTTSFNNLTNVNDIIQTCNVDCTGLVTISSGDTDGSNNIFGIFNLSEIVTPQVINGAKSALTGNESDITRLQQQFELCNNMSAQARLLNYTEHLSQNLTACYYDNGQLSQQASSCELNLGKMTTDYDKSKKNTPIYVGIFCLLAGGLVWFGRPYLQKGGNFRDKHVDDFSSPTGRFDK